jgi:hypothetical protein
LFPVTVNNAVACHPDGCAMLHDNINLFRQILVLPNYGLLFLAKLVE